MKRIVQLSFLLSYFFFSLDVTQAQQLWNAELNTLTFEKDEVYARENLPQNFKLLSLNLNDFNNQVQVLQSKGASKIIQLPDANGVLKRFSIKETSNFQAGLQAKYPSIRSYTAQGIDDPTAIAKISTGTDGFHAVIFSGKEETVYIDPHTKDNSKYIVYKRSSLSKLTDEFKCEFEGSAKNDVDDHDHHHRAADDSKLRTYRIAIATSGGYSQFHLNNQGVDASASDADKKAAVISALNTSLTRINGVFEKDLAVHFVLVNDNDKIVFLDEDTDGISDGSAGTMINEVQTICDNEIGDANYDIGHVFSIAGSGLAGVGVVCVSGQKARGVTGISSPISDPYDIDYVAHEIGHQFGATHTQNNDCNRTNSTAVEPGSGSTIMGYAGICSPNVISVGSATGNSDDHFHAVSIQQMWETITSSGNCAVQTDTNNAIPTANAGSDFSIPKSTPFRLVGVATDADGLSTLTYNWEQIDNTPAQMPPLATNTVGPAFRSLPSKDSPIRYMPDLETVVGGNLSNTWEVLASVERDYNFSFFVRDNNAGGGGAARDDMMVSVVDVDPFTVTSQTTAESWDVGSTQTITWNVGSTNAAPINSALVNIRLSIDGGVTFPIYLKTDTPNDGTEDIVVPNNPSTDARIMVEASDNIFYNINPLNFTVNSTTPTFILNNNSGVQTACNTGGASIDYTLNFDFVNGFNETVTFTTTGEPSGATVTFSPTSINADGDVTMTISNFDGATAQEYTINVVGTSTSVTQNVNAVLQVRSSTFNALNLTSPTNGATDISLTEVLMWDADFNASSYDVEIASDNAFTTIVSSGNVTTNSYEATNLAGTTEYFWRVKPKNQCGEGAFSSVFSFTTQVPEYCTSTFTDDAGGAEHILNVTFGGINNSSGNDTADGYEDFTSISTNVLRGQTREISVRMNTDGYQDHCYVFIDWNQDFSFDNATERYDLGTELADVGTLTQNITIPADAKFGSTRMRVIIEYDDPSNGFGEGACDADHIWEWGETEDYTINVVEPNLQFDNITVQTLSESCQGQDDGQISVSINQQEFTYKITITGPGATVNDLALTQLNYTLAGLAPGAYTVCVLAEEVATSQCFEINVDAAAQIALKVGNVKQSNKYSFRVDSGSPPYEVFLNDNLIAVSSDKNFDLEIEGSGTLKVKTSKECEGVYQKNIGDIFLKQNPITSVIGVGIPFEADPFIQATVFDVSGKIVFANKVQNNNGNLEIPFANYAKGVYILKLEIEGAEPLKIIKQ